MPFESIFIALIGLVSAVFIGFYYRVDRKLVFVKLDNKNLPKISIIIPAHNAGKFLEKCLKCVKASDYSNKEIVVINDCSTDNTESIIKAFNGIRVLKNNKRMGKAESLNRGTNIASGDVFLFLDADTFLEKDTISRLVSSYENYDKDNIGFISPMYRLVDGQGIIAKLAHIEQSIHQFLIKIQMNTGSILSIRGCCLLVNKHAFEDVHGFSNNLLEDGDFAAKIAKAGYKMKYEPRAYVKTDEPDNIRDLFRTRKRYGKGGLFCLLNHPRHFILSKQSMISFYPHALAIIAFMFVSIFSLSFASSTPLTFIFLFIKTIYLLSSSVGQVALASTVGLFVCGSFIASKSIKKSSVFLFFLPYIFLYLPFVTIGYAYGAVNGILDKIKERGELKLKDW